MSLLIINADDFGYSTGVNYGIIHSYQQGILTSTTMITTMPGFEEGVKLAEENPGLGIGVHLSLTCGKPLREDVPSLIQSNGQFHQLSFYEEDFKIDLDELYKEWKEQIERVVKRGIKPTHLDSHHHVNSLSPITEVFIQLAKEYDLPVRNNFDVPTDILTTKRFNTSFDLIGMTKEIWKPMELKNIVQECQMFGEVEAMCHPGYVDQVLLANSSLRDGRAVTVAELSRSDYANILKENDIQLGTYSDL